MAIHAQADIGGSEWGMALYDRATALRLFLRVVSVDLDASGNARAADVRFLDRVGERVVWRRWTVGQKLHWHPFKVSLLNTKRAGLHVASEWRDARGDMRYAGNYMLRHEGVFVISPGNVVCVAEPLVTALSVKPEADLIDDVLRVRFGWDTPGFGRPSRNLHYVHDLDEAAEARVARLEAA